MIAHEKIRYLNCSVASRIGARETNQDNYLFNSSRIREEDNSQLEECIKSTKSTKLFAVFDGVGSYSGSGAVSQKLAESFSHVRIRPNKLDALDDFDHAYDEACSKLEELFFQNISGMTTFACVAVVGGNHCIAANVGDSPIYLFRGGKARQLSQKHTFFGELERDNKPIPEDASDGLVKYIDTLSSHLIHRPYIQTGILHAGDILVLCSDGVMDRFSPEELYDELQSGKSAAEILEQINTLPDSDNATLAIIRIQSTK